MADGAAAIAQPPPQLGPARVANAFKQLILLNFSAFDDSLPFARLMSGGVCMPNIPFHLTGDGMSLGRDEIDDNIIASVVHIVGNNIVMKIKVNPNCKGVEVRFFCAQRGASKKGEKKEKLTPQDYLLLRKFIKEMNPRGKPQTHLENKHLEENALAWILECLRLDMSNNAIHVHMIPSKEDWIKDAKASAAKPIIWTVQPGSEQNFLRGLARMGYVESEENLRDVLKNESESEEYTEEDRDLLKQAAQAMEKLSKFLKGEVKCRACKEFIEQNMQYINQKNAEYFLQRMRSKYVLALEGEVEVQNLLDKFRLLIQTVVGTMDFEKQSDVIEWIFATFRNDNSLDESDVEDDSDEMETDDSDETAPSEVSMREARVLRSKSVREEMLDGEAAVAAGHRVQLQNMSPRDVERLEERLNTMMEQQADDIYSKIASAVLGDYNLQKLDELLDYAVAFVVGKFVLEKLGDEFEKVSKDTKQPDYSQKKVERTVTQRLWSMLKSHGRNDLSNCIAEMIYHLIAQYDNSVTDKMLYDITKFSRMGYIEEMDGHYERKDFRKISTSLVRDVLTKHSDRIVGCFPTEDDLYQIWEELKTFYIAEVIRIVVQFMYRVKQNEDVIQAVNDLMKKQIEIVLTANAKTEFQLTDLSADEIPEEMTEWLFSLKDKFVTHRDFVGILFGQDDSTRKQFRNELNLIAIMTRIWWQVMGKDGPTKIMTELFKTENEIYLKRQDILGDNISCYNKLLEEYDLEKYSQEQAGQQHAGWMWLVEPFVLTWHLGDHYNLARLMSIVDKKSDVVESGFKTRFDAFWLHNAQDDTGSSVSGELENPITDTEVEAESGSSCASSMSSSGSSVSSSGSSDSGNGADREAKVPRLGE